MANEISILIKGDGTQAQKAIKDVSGAAEEGKGHLTGFGSALSGIFQTAGGFMVANTVIAGFDGIKEGITGAFHAAIDYQKIQAQTEAALKSTGDASGMTAKGIRDLADEISKSTGIQDENVQAGENMLLTFTNIGKNAFPEATKAVVDMTASFQAAGKGMNISDIAIMVGKALNDPIHGMTNLQRVGVAFTDAQKEVVKQMVATGNTAGAQKLILQELEREFGGSAEAAGNTLGGQLDKLHNIWDDFTRDLAAKALPALVAAAGFFAGELPKALDLAGQGFDKLAGFIKPILNAAWDKVAGPIREMASALLDLGKAEAPKVFGALTDLAKLGIDKIGPPIKDMADSLVRVAQVKFDAMNNFWDNLSSNQKHIVEATAAFGGMGGALVALKTYWPQITEAIGHFREALQPAVDILKPLAEQVLVALKNNFEQVGQALLPLGQAVLQLIDAFKPLEPIIKPLAEIIGVTLVVALAALLKGTQLIIDLFTVQLVASIKVATLAIEGIAKSIDFVNQAVMDWAPKVWDGMKAVFSRVEEVAGEIVGKIKGIPGLINAWQIGADIIHWIGQGLLDTLGSLGGVIGKVKDKLDPRNWDLPGLSPLPDAMVHAGQIAGNNFAAGLGSTLPAVQATVDKWGQTLATSVSKYAQIIGAQMAAVGNGANTFASSPTVNGGAAAPGGVTGPNGGAPVITDAMVKSGQIPGIQGYNAQFDTTTGKWQYVPIAYYGGAPGSLKPGANPQNLGPNDVWGGADQHPGQYWDGAAWRSLNVNNAQSNPNYGQVAAGQQGGYIDAATGRYVPLAAGQTPPSQIAAPNTIGSRQPVVVNINASGYIQDIQQLTRDITLGMQRAGVI